ncbi:MAG: Asp-tRNA(Asn)/Glu-tRNA(Gln) amidotransferase subunit GatA [Lachnospiraceae bacterium]|nr:Asp-tRNA(Asn)/Glu-tRNA(Gln) amidotransferase subunit GatA [Lachnospiraceae bacterium]
MELTKLTALELAAKIRAKEVSVSEAVEAQLEQIEKKDSLYHCYTSILADEARARAKEVQKQINDGTLTSPLAGVPVAIKDNICTKGIPTTCSSKMLEHFRPPYDATVVECMNAAGTITVGKLNMDEFAMGSTTETSYFGVTKNPRDITRVPGGSSGGAAAAAAAEEAFLTLGSDTGGSIRQPASFCGVTGIKPTYGTVSRYGLIAYASSLDQIGPIARSAADCAAALDVISGSDKRDSTCVDREHYGYLNALTGDIRGMKIGMPAGYFAEGLDEEVRKSIYQAADVLRSLGASVEEFDLKGVKYAIPAYYVIASAEASSNLSRYDGVKYGYRIEKFEGLQEVYKNTRSEGFGNEVKRRMMIGAFVLSSGYYDAYYNKALKVKALIKQSFDEAFEKYDCVLGPTAPTTAMKLGESLSDPLKMYLGDIYTVSVNLAGLPGISVPCGTDKSGLPIGMQLIGRPFGEKEILRAADAYEHAE